MQSVCLPTPSPESECVPPLDPKGEQHSFAGDGVEDLIQTTG